MVQVEEIREKYVDDSDFTDASGSGYESFEEREPDSVSLAEPEHETLLERLEALKYMVSYGTRSIIHAWYVRGRRLIRSALVYFGKFSWVFVTSTFLVGFPLFYEYQKEQQVKLMDSNIHFAPPDQIHGTPLTPNVFPLK